MTTIERETSAAVAKLPPGPPFPRAVQGALALANRRIALQILRRVYGSAFTIDLPIFGQLVVTVIPTIFASFSRPLRTSRTRPKPTSAE